MSMSRGYRNLRWIERYCLVPNGTNQGKPVQLSAAERVVLSKIYDAPGGPRDDVAVPKPLAAYISLLHLCGPEALQEKFRPAFEVDSWTVWNSTSDRLRDVLERHGEKIVCGELGTEYPAAA
jgi:hypothetical protein